MIYELEEQVRHRAGRHVHTAKTPVQSSDLSGPQGLGLRWLRARPGLRDPYVQPLILQVGIPPCLAVHRSTGLETETLHHAPQKTPQRGAGKRTKAQKKLRFFWQPLEAPTRNRHQQNKKLQAPKKQTPSWLLELCFAVPRIIKSKSNDHHKSK